MRPEWTGRRVSSRLLPGRSEPTDSDAGQTDVSVDPAHRNDRTPRGRSFRRRRQRRRSTTLRLALRPFHRPVCLASFWTSKAVCLLSHNRLSSHSTDDSVVTSPQQADGPGSSSSADRTALTPAVAYDGDLVVSRRTLVPVSFGEPTQHPAFSWQQFLLEPQFPPTSGGSTHDAKLHFASQSLADSALSLSAHCRD